MEFHVTRTLNGVPVSDEEMKSIPLMNDEIREFMAQIKARLLSECEKGLPG